MHYEISEDAARELVAALEKKRAADEDAQAEQVQRAAADPVDTTAKPNAGAQRLVKNLDRATR